MPYLRFEDDDSSTTGTVGSVLLGAVAGFAVGMLVAQRRHEILDLPVHRHGDGGAEQALADRPHDVGRKSAGSHVTRGAVGQHEGELPVLGSGGTIDHE